MSVKQLKKEMIATLLSVIVSLVALSSATYAWYVSNSNVEAQTANVAAMANGMMLQIVAGTKPDHGKDNETIAFDTTGGHEISPSSTDDIKTWYVPSAWSDGAMVSGYSVVIFSDADTGEYIVGKNATDSKKYYAYNVSTYTLYTVRDTGIADVYLDGSQADGAITVTSNGQQLDDKVAKSMRIGISTVDKNGNETLRFVYAPSEPTGYGNDVYSKNNSITGWITVSNETSTKNATYSHIYAKNYIDQNSKNWAASKDGKSFIKPVSNASPIASGIDYNGIILKVYVWLEGTDSDCINTAADVVNEDLSYDVTLHMVGVNSDN